jgi:esterase/lipase superfamily enzyme
MYGSRPGPLDLGVLRVTVPVKGRKAGDIPRPAWYRLQFHEDVRKHVVLGSVTPLSPEQWVSDFRASVEATTDSAALVFVHGFNVSFVEAAWRAGQLAYDLAFDGTTAMYSWPSKDDPEAYFVDRTTADQSAGRLADFLTLITERTGARRVHLVAHSLGNQVLAQALDEMARRELGGMAMGAVGGSRQGAAPPSSRPMPWFNHVVLAAPDIDATLFSETIFPRIRGTAQDWTLYASTQDLALGVSSRIAGYTRLGKIRGTPTIIDGVTTIDASVVKGDLIGHSYFADVLPLIQDLHDLIALNAEPSRRNALRPSGPFWVLRWGE